MKKFLGMFVILGVAVTAVGLYAAQSSGSNIFSGKTSIAKEQQIIAGTGTQDNEKNPVIIPETCSVRFDGCNTCQIMEDGALACTKMYCAENEAPKCLEHKNKDEVETSVIVPETCSVRFDGCNTCQVMENGEMACTLMYCAENEEPKCLEHK